MIETGAVEILPLGIDDVPRMKELMRKYRDLPMDLADAALVRVAERERLRRIFTLDRRDFQIYRPSRIGRFVIFPTRQVQKPKFAQAGCTRGVGDDRPRCELLLV